MACLPTWGRGADPRTDLYFPLTSSAFLRKLPGLVSRRSSASFVPRSPVIVGFQKSQWASSYLKRRYKRSTKLEERFSLARM